VSPGSAGAPQSAERRLRLEITGAVQGVGFRPHVYRLARSLNLGGWVTNDARGVVIEVEGDDDALNAFLDAVRASPPERALIRDVRASWLAAAGLARFEIRASDAGGERTAIVMPDVATCDACLRDVAEPDDRRFGYAFTNCTGCGPRFTIVRALPYDRANTTMAGFRMCAACAGEYDDPGDRRFHAQPNACAVCGPRLALWAADGSPALEAAVRVTAMGRADDRASAGAHAGSAPEPAGRVRIHGVASDDAAEPAGRIRVDGVASDDVVLDAVAAALVAGRIAAVKGLGGFHLMADARNDAAVRALRERKGRERKPLALMARDLDQVGALCSLSEEVAHVLRAPDAPIVLLHRRPDADVAPSVAPDNPYLGVMLPATPLHHLLLGRVPGPLVATSGNRSDEPICTDEHEAVERLRGIADLFLVHDRPIERHADDSIVAVIAAAPRVLRRARGRAPLPIALADAVPPILAVGGQLKNTIALARGHDVFISQHIGDLETPQARAAFARVIADFLRFYDVTPIVIAHDLHPGYVSTDWALRREYGGAAGGDGGSLARDRAAFDGTGLTRIAVQHHHAHLAACLAENATTGRALGVIWDGTGYGTDGTIWGGEFILGDAAGFERVAHLRPFRLPGGDAAVREPRRAALALLYEIGTADAAASLFDGSELRVLSHMLDTGTHAPITTSMGRLFDGVAALIGLPARVAFEGEAAMALEFVADQDEPSSYDVPLGTGTAGALVLDWEPALRAIVADRTRAVTPGTIAARFHNGLVAAAVAVAERVGESRVALSGGCFQNRLLTGRLTGALHAAGFDVLLHRQVPPNDGGISLGQVAVAAAALAPSA
jgi:hydrogenase maturation protein HypF